MLLDHSSNKLVSMKVKIDRPLENWLWRWDITQLPRDKGSFHWGYNSVHIDYKHMPNGRHEGGECCRHWKDSGASQTRIPLKHAHMFKLSLQPRGFLDSFLRPPRFLQVKEVDSTVWLKHFPLLQLQIFTSQLLETHNVLKGLKSLQVTVQTCV